MAWKAIGIIIKPHLPCPRRFSICKWFSVKCHSQTDSKIDKEDLPIDIENIKAGGNNEHRPSKIGDDQLDRGGSKG